MNTPAPAPAGTATAGRTPVVVIGSGKGGTGKSLLTVVLGDALARRGLRVLLADGAVNQGNLHLLLGARPSRATTAVLQGTARPRDLLVRVAERLWLLPADSGDAALCRLERLDRARLATRLSSVYDLFDCVLVDAGPGVEAAVQTVRLRASRLVLVVTAEPAALSDAFALVKLVRLDVPALPIDVIANRTSDPAEGEAAFEVLDLAARRFLGGALRRLAVVAEDAELARRSRRPCGLLGAGPPGIREVAGALATSLDAPCEGVVR
jgi:flagellar biosynthesis protein FlhG